MKFVIGLAFGAMLSGRSLNAQIPPSAVSRSSVDHRAARSPQVVAAQVQLLREMSPWVGWGGAIGLGGGVIYALSKDYETENGGLANMAAPFQVILDVCAGCVVGMAGGLIAFLVNKAF